MANLSCRSETTGDNGTFINNGPVVVANNATIPFTTNSLINGISITHTPGSASILLSPSKTYFVFYKATTPSGTTRSQFLLNGAAVGGSGLSIIPGPMVAAGVIINTPPSPNPSILQLQNITGATQTFNEIAVTVISLM